MKTKLITIALMSILLVACGKSEEEKKKEEAQAQFVTALIEKNQKTAVIHVLNVLSSLKSSTSDYYSFSAKCPSKNLSNPEIALLKQFPPDDFPHNSIDPPFNPDSAEISANEYIDNIEYISVTDFPNLCQIKTTFKDSVFIPDLSKESIILTMSISKGTFYWKCQFTGKNKRDIPKSCR